MKSNFLRLKDTIASIASFPDQAAVGIIKISGPNSLSVASRVFRSKRKKKLKSVASFTLHYGWIIDRGQKTEDRRQRKKRGGDGVVDEVLVGVMKAPFSYTREDVVEIYSHSGQLVLQKILGLVLKQGARLAEPGEFTKRAFLSGRIDLAQAEAVLDIINAKSQDALTVSVSQLKGELSYQYAEGEKRIRVYWQR